MKFLRDDGKEITYIGREFGNFKVIDNKYKKIVKLDDLFYYLLKVWDVDTVFPSSAQNYRKANDPTYGQASITSVLVNELFGGEIYMYKFRTGGMHFFNIINDEIIDLTSDQYTKYKIKVKYDNGQIVDRDDVCSTTNSRRRLQLLKDKLSEVME